MRRPTALNYRSGVMKITLKDSPATRHELAFGVIVVVLAFLGKGNPGLFHPRALVTILLLMAVNLAAGGFLRRSPVSPGLSAGLVTANLALITALVAFTGGSGSSLWVLFLLPIFTACLLLAPPEAAGFTAAVIAVNAGFAFFGERRDPAVLALEALLKSGLFAFAALLAWRLAEAERDTRRRLESESRRADELAVNLEASAALSDIGLVGAGVAHDLRNTFMVITGFAEAIEAQGPLAPELRHGFERIRRVAELGGQIALQLARNGSNAPLERSVEDLGSIAGDVAKLVKGSFLRKGVLLVVEDSGEPCPVLASRVHLQRVFLNLLLNALSAGAAQTTVRLSLRREGRDAVAVVEDEGPGFPAEVLSRLFQAYETTRASGGGLGLGLNLCARIAREHEGRLGAENRPERGARLTLRLPLAAASPTPRHPSRA